MIANLEDLLNERVIECDILNPHDFTIKWLRLRQQQRHTCRNSMKHKKKTAVIAYFCCCLVGTLVWPQWWSFADVSQQWIDFSKIMSKIKIFFWFDLHKCSHGRSKIRRHFRNKSRSILKLSKNVFYKKCGPKLILFNDFFFRKNSDNFWCRKMTLKVRIMLFSTFDSKTTERPKLFSWTFS